MQREIEIEIYTVTEKVIIISSLSRTSASPKPHHASHKSDQRNAQAPSPFPRHDHHKTPKSNPKEESTILISVPKNLLRTLHQILAHRSPPPPSLNLTQHLALLSSHKMTRRDRRNGRKRHVRTIRGKRHPRLGRRQAELVHARAVENCGLDAGGFQGFVGSGGGEGAQGERGGGGCCGSGG